MNHLLVHSGAGVEAVFCEICFKKFPRKSYLRSHMKRHQVLECPTCSLPFDTQMDLKMHCKIHKRIHACDTCPRSFSSLHHLKVWLVSIITKS